MFRQFSRSGVCRTCATTRHFSASSLLFQIQNKEDTLATHGAGYVQHKNMAQFVPDNANSFVARNISKAAPAPDLYRTKVEEGLGTSDKDPYFRTLPNINSAAPESSVLRTAAITAPTLDELQSLSARWGSMGYWLGDQHPRLPLFLRSLLVEEALPVSATAEALVRDFVAKGIPSAMEGRPKEEQAQLEDLWKKAVQNYGALSGKFVFDRLQFETSLNALHEASLQTMRAVAPKEEVELALEVLRRTVVLKRNAFIEDALLPVVNQGPYLGYGDAVWRIFLEAAEKHKGEIFIKQGNELVGFAWDAVMLEDQLRLPEITAPVALYLTLLSTALSKELAPETLKNKSRFLDDGVSASFAKASPSPFLPVNPIVKRKFAQKELRGVLSTANGAAALAKVLHLAGHHELSREASLCESINNAQRLREAEAEGVVGHFENTTEVKWLLTSLLNMKNEKVHTCVAQTFGTRTTGNVDWDKVMNAVDWTNNWRRLSLTLLSNDDVLVAMQTVISNAINAKGVSHRLISAEYAEELKRIQQARKEREEGNKEKMEHIVSELSSFSAVDKALDMLVSLGVDMTALQKEATAIGEQQLTSRCTVEPEVLQFVLSAVSARHPSWVKAGVIRTPASAKQLAPLAGLEEMVRMFVRLTYVPQTGAAAIAQHTRRRIGPIGTKPHQYNVPVEMGIVEQYDNLQYKRYDWQGWYQRMVDVHNRNVSIRCRLDDLKRLDSNGAPFIDLQTERRLRIISGDHVGMGVLKLDSDKFEDQKDNITHGTTKLSEILAESRKAQLGPEYWPSVEVKVRRPSGQSQAYYSIMDNERIEKTSKELYQKYKDAKKRSLFVTPMDMWLEVKGMQVRKATDNQDKEGYSVDMIDAMNDPKE